MMDGRTGEDRAGFHVDDKSHGAYPFLRHNSDPSKVACVCSLLEIGMYPNLRPPDAHEDPSLRLYRLSRIIVYAESIFRRCKPMLILLPCCGCSCVFPPIPLCQAFQTSFHALTSCCCLSLDLGVSLLLRGFDSSSTVCHV